MNMQQDNLRALLPDEKAYDDNDGALLDPPARETPQKAPL